MSEHIVTLKGGKAYPTWPYTLNEAHERGLKRLEMDVLQYPTAENGHHAVVRATAEFEDGRLFSDIGDAVPAPNSPQIRPLALASTRAAGRALRSACNIGEAMAEDAAEDGTPQAHAGGGGMSHFCAWDGCGVQITQGQLAVSSRRWGQGLCPTHQAAKEKAG